MATLTVRLLMLAAIISCVACAGEIYCKNGDSSCNAKNDVSRTRYTHACHKPGFKYSYCYHPWLAIIGIPFAMIGVCMVISCMRRPLLDTRPESERPTTTVAPTAVKSHQMEPAFEAYPPGEQHYGGDLYPHEGYAVDRYGRPYDPASYPGGPETTTTTTEYKQPYPQPGEGATYPPHGYDAPEPYSAEPTGGHHQYDYPPGEPARVRHQYDYPPGEPEEEEVAPAGEKKKKRYRKKKQEEEHDTVV